MDSTLRKLAIEKVNTQLTIRRIEREGLIQKMNSTDTTAPEKAAAHCRLAKIDHESRGLDDSLKLLEDEDRLSGN